MDIITIEKLEEWESLVDTQDSLYIEFNSTHLQEWVPNGKTPNQIKSVIQDIQKCLEKHFSKMTHCQIRFSHIQNQSFKIEIGNMTIRDPENGNLYRVFKEYFEEVKEN